MKLISALNITKIMPSLKLPNFYQRNRKPFTCIVAKNTKVLLYVKTYNKISD
jgi:hypothetical protein